MNSRIKHLAKLVLYLAPDRLNKYLHKKIDARRLEESMARYKRCKVSKEEVQAVLDQIDFDRDIMLHTSTMNIGHIAGGAKWLAEEIIRRMDLTKHTLIVSALPYFGAFAEFLKDDMVFDVHTAPIAMGAVNERMGARPDAYRSAHPTHSVVAIGKDAEFYAGTHHLDLTPFGPNSPYWKLIQRGAHVLLFGATFNNVTFIHAVEDALGDEYPVKKIYSKHIYNVNCVTQTGRKVTVRTPVHNALTCITRDSNFLFGDSVDNGIARCWKLGEGYVCDVDSIAFSRRYIELLQKGVSIYGRCRKLDPSRTLEDYIKLEV